MSDTKVALITGAANGLGRAIAEVAAGRGYSLVLTDRSEDGLQTAKKELLAAGAEVLVQAADVAHYEQVASVVDLADTTYGKIDLLVNNAGVESSSYLWETPPAEFGRVLDINTKGVMHGIHAALQIMLGQKGPEGAVVNVASLASLASGPAQQASYNASKHAVLALTECLRLELDEVGSRITTHVVLPGPVATRIFNDAEASTDGGKAWRERLIAYVRDQGCTSAEAATRVFEGLDRGDFWISTHPDMHADFAERRARLLTDRETPVAAAVSF